MQWSKYRALQELHPWLIEAIDPFQRLSKYGSPNERSNGVIREFVRSKLEFVAFRPFERIDLRKVIETWDESNDPFVCDPHFGGNLNHSLDVEWMLTVCVASDGRQVTHVLSLKDGESISDQLASIDTMYRRTWPKGVTVSWVALVRSVAESYRSGDDSRLAALRIEIFSFPSGFDSRPIPDSTDIAQSAGDRVAHRAFMRGTLMPPLIPGTTSFAG